VKDYGAKPLGKFGNEFASRGWKGVIIAAVSA